MNNFTNNRWLTVIILLLLTANIATLTILWVHHRGGNREDNKLLPPPGRQVFEFLSNELKLDSTQRAAYRKLRDEHQAGQKTIQDSIGKAKDAFFALLQQSNIDDATVQAAAKKASDTQQQLEILTFRHFQKLRAICNPEQQKKFDTIIQDVLRRMAPPKNRLGPPPGRHGEGPGRFPPPDGPPGDEPPPQQH